LGAALNWPPVCEIELEIEQILMAQRLLDDGDAGEA
jgi:hypothetical protein